MLNLTNNLLLQLKFIASPGSGAIGLAHFLTSPGLCQTLSNAICDFESGNCNWTSSSVNSAFGWKLTEANGNSWGGVTGSEYDHTTETEYGHFMEASSGISSSNLFSLRGNLRNFK